MYMTEQPFLTGMKEMSKIFKPGAFNPEKETGSRGFEFLGEKVTEGAMAVVPGVSSFGNYLTRMSDPKCLQIMQLLVVKINGLEKHLM